LTGATIYILENLNVAVLKFGMPDSMGYLNLPATIRGFYPE